MYEIDLYGDGRFTKILSHQDVQAIFLPTVETLRRVNRLTKEVLRQGAKRSSRRMAVV